MDTSFSATPSRVCRHADYKNPAYARNRPMRARRIKGWWVSVRRYNALADAYNELQDDIDQILRGG